MARRNETFSAITTEGGLLPADLLQALLSPKGDIDGSNPQSYHLATGEKIGDQVNRSWNRLQGCWQNYRKAIAAKAEGEPTTTETRERWLYPLFQELGFGRLAAARPIQTDGREYPVSHAWESVPIHLVGSHVDLDRRTPGAVGAARMSPHSMLQQALNNSDGMLWGLVSNGLTLRLLRDNVALSRQALVEFDLETILEGDLYGEFLLLWMVCHQSRFEGERPECCWLEKWKKIAEDTGLRALENLRPGVEAAITALGSGFVAHRANAVLRQKLCSGTLSPHDLYQQVLRVVYRMLFLFVAEDRGLLHPEDDSETARKARKRYSGFYSLGRLRSMRLNRAGTPHPDLWNAFRLVSQKLSSSGGCPELALPPLGSFLWSVESTSDLDDCLIPNRNFLEAVHALAFVRDGNVRRSVDYRNLGAEELGSVYEGLLELHPVVNADAGAFELNLAAGNERKTTGSYYTPDSLVQCLLDSALEPVTAEAVKGKQGEEAAKAILELKVCDPAVGSGHFLIAAAHRMAKRIAAIRSGEEEPSPTAVRSALRQVVGRCLYGVDINPMAAELCKVSLWLEALEPGKPLSFLDHHIRVGNSLLGATPELIAKGIPDEAFKPIEGDDKTACSELKKINARERKGLGDLFAKEESDIHASILKASQALDTMPDDTPAAIASKTRAFEQAETNYATQIAKTIADTWCAAFVIQKLFPPGEKQPFGITQRYIQEVSQGHALPNRTREAVQKLADQYQFFHWHLAFPEVFERGGFDVVLGNPPWEKLQVEEQSFFSGRHIQIAETSARTRKRLIQDLALSDPTLFQAWITHRRTASAIDALLKQTSRFPLSGTGKLNTYSLFTELMAGVAQPIGRLACVVPLGLVTDEGSSLLFGHLVEKRRLAAIFGFENESLIFASVHHSFKFCLLVLSGKARPIERTVLSFFCRSTADAIDPSRRYILRPGDVIQLNPNSLTCPIFRNTKEAELVRHVYCQFQVISSGRTKPSWNVRIQRILNSTDDVSEFHTITPDATRQHRLKDNNSPLLEPIYEAKMFHQFDHRFGTYVGQTEAQANQGKLPELTDSDHADPTLYAQPRWWIESASAQERTRKYFGRKWVVVFRDITSPVVLRTAISAVLPHFCTTETCRCVFFLAEPHIEQAAVFLAAFNSFVFDFVSRTKFSGNHLSTFIVLQLPLPTADAVHEQLRLLGLSDNFLRSRLLEVVYTAWDLQPFARDWGYDGPPFRWDEARRFVLRCELDAAFFHLYLPANVDGQWKPARVAQGAVRDETEEELAELKKHFLTPRDAVAYIMDTFPIVKRKDEEKHGSYRTKDTILAIYDAMQEAIRTGQPYQTRLDPPPADSLCCHPPRN